MSVLPKSSHGCNEIIEARRDQCSHCSCGLGEQAVRTVLWCPVCFSNGDCDITYYLAQPNIFQTFFVPNINLNHEQCFFFRFQYRISLCWLHMSWKLGFTSSMGKVLQQFAVESGSFHSSVRYFPSVFCILCSLDNVRMHTVDKSNDTSWK